MAQRQNEPNPASQPPDERDDELETAEDEDFEDDDSDDEIGDDEEGEDVEE